MRPARTPGTSFAPVLLNESAWMAHRAFVRTRKHETNSEMEDTMMMFGAGWMMLFGLLAAGLLLAVPVALVGLVAVLVARTVRR